MKVVLVQTHVIRVYSIPERCIKYLLDKSAYEELAAQVYFMECEIDNLLG